MLPDPDGPAFVLAPHLDDAVLSCWHRLRTPGPVTVVTVCAGVPEEGTLGRFDPIVGATDSAALVRERRAEDAAALACAGRTPHLLDHLDHQYRDHPLDVGAIADELDARVEGAAALWAPAGLGRHPDHLAVRAAGIEVAHRRGLRLRLYADLPYAANLGWPHWVTGAPADPRLVPEAAWVGVLGEVGGPDELTPHPVRLAPGEVAAKLDALERYASQLPVLDAGPVGRLRHPAVIGYELWWAVGR